MVVAQKLKEAAPNFRIQHQRNISGEEAIVESEKELSSAEELKADPVYADNIIIDNAKTDDAEEIKQDNVEAENLIVENPQVEKTP
ncbi:hypothetical protein KIW84_044294 [Lathyrus oleraceus]|uniref:Uncharacterized protein n=1 Tax=Pisum sativum TaxID=3888 RepID=A0A9D5ASU3_PEA|nr:hypothetical protein KIW84_044294 [Pisum sativum]